MTIRGYFLSISCQFREFIDLLHQTEPEKKDCKMELKYALNEEIWLLNYCIRITVFWLLILNFHLTQGRT